VFLIVATASRPFLRAPLVSVVCATRSPTVKIGPDHSFPSNLRSRMRGALSEFPCVSSWSGTEIRGSCTVVFISTYFKVECFH
jgi:hypothetical protein